MSDKPVLYFPELEGHEIDIYQTYTTGIALHLLIASFIIALITLPFHAVVTEYNDWRHIEQNNTVVQRDGLWTSCVKIQEAQTECELIDEGVFWAIHSANIIAFIFLLVNVVADLVTIVLNTKYNDQVGILKLSIGTHMFAAFTVMITWILFLLDTNTNRSDDKMYTLQWCFYLAIATSVLEFIAVFLRAFHLRFLRKWDLDWDLNEIKKSIEKEQPVEKSPLKPQPPTPQPPMSQPPKPQTPKPQTRQPLIGFQQFQQTEASNRHQSSSDKPQDQTIPMVLTMHLISVVRTQNQNMPEVQPIQLIPVVRSKDQNKPEVQPMQFILVVHFNDNKMPEVQPMQLIQVVPTKNQTMPEVQPIQLISAVPTKDQTMPEVQQMQHFSVAPTKDQTMPEAQPMQLIPVGPSNNQRLEVQPKQFILKVQRKGPHYNVLKILMKDQKESVGSPKPPAQLMPPKPTVQPMQPMPTVQPMPPLPKAQPMQPMPPVQPMQPMPPMPTVQPMQPMQPMPTVQPMQPMPTVQPMQSMPTVQPMPPMPTVQPMQPMLSMPTAQPIRPMPMSPIVIQQTPYPAHLYLY